LEETDNPRGWRIAERARIDGSGGNVRDSAPNALPCVFKNHIPSARVIRQLALDDNAKATKLKQHVRPVQPMHMDRLCIRGYSKSGDEDCELGVYYFFAVALFGHRSNLAWVS
ncbi:MAG: hypothetical protein ACREDM_16780, partial [Methylocella sp.]